MYTESVSARRLNYNSPGLSQCLAIPYIDLILIGQVGKGFDFQSTDFQNVIGRLTLSFTQEVSPRLSFGPSMTFAFG